MKSAFENIADAYRAMAKEAHYRPMAPSDGWGNITADLEDLDLNAEADEYAARFRAEEDTCSFYIGCTDYRLAKATVYSIEAARLLCGVAREPARRLLTMALAELSMSMERIPET